MQETSTVSAFLLSTPQCCSEKHPCAASICVGAMSIALCCNVACIMTCRITIFIPHFCITDSTDHHADQGMILRRSSQPVESMPEVSTGCIIQLRLNCCSICMWPLDNNPLGAACLLSAMLATAADACFSTAHARLHHMLLHYCRHVRYCRLPERQYCTDVHVDGGVEASSDKHTVCQ